MKRNKEGAAEQRSFFRACRKKYGILWIVFFCLASVSVQAAPSMGAETGNPVTPSADLLREGQAAFGWQEKGKERSFRLAAAPAERWEVSLQRSAAHDDRAGVKFAVQPESIFKPGIALGVEDLSAERQRSVYGVVSKTLPYGVRLHAGAGNGRFRGLFAAAEVRLFPKGRPGVFPDTSVYAEYAGKHGSLGCRVSLLRGAKLSFGVEGHEHFIGLSYVYDGL